MTVRVMEVKWTRKSVCMRMWGVCGVGMGCVWIWYVRDSLEEVERVVLDKLVLVHEAGSREVL